MAVPAISDEFTNRTGRIGNYDNLLGIRASDPDDLGPFTAPSNGLPTALANKHIDLRSFLNDSASRSTTQFDLARMHQHESAQFQRLITSAIPDDGTFTLIWNDENDNTYGASLLYSSTANNIRDAVRDITGREVTVTGDTFPFLISFPDESLYTSLLEVESNLSQGGNPVDASVEIVEQDFSFLQTASIPDPVNTQDQMALLRSTRSEAWNIVADNYDSDDLEIGPLNTYNYWNGLRLLFDSTRDINTIYLNSPGHANPINLLRLEENVSDIDISMTIPGFASLPLDATQCALQFTSHYLGKFDMGADSAQVLFQGNLLEDAGYTEFRADLSDFDTASINWRSVTGVRIKLVGSGALPIGQFVVLSIRAFSQTEPWVAASLDVNTVTERLVRPISLNGYTDTSSYVAVPPMLRANLEVPSGIEDPRPSDGSLSLRFYTGELATVGGENVLQLIFREQEFGAQHAEWMVAELRFGQDFINLKRYMVKRTESGGNYTDEILGDISETLQSDDVAPEEGERPLPGTFAPFKKHTNYLFQAEVINNGFRVGIFEMDTNGVINFTHYETTLEYQAAWVRRAGRVGFYANLVDEDISAEYFRNSSTAYSIFRTAVFRSRTPVDGAQLYVSSSGPKQLFTEFLPRTSGDRVIEDPTKNPATTAKTWRIQGTGQDTNHGVLSNPMYFDDFENMTVEFDVWLHSEMRDDKRPKLYLIDPEEGNNLASSIGPIEIQGVAGGFSHNKINMKVYKFKTVGLYRIHLVSETPHANPWWISNMQVSRRTVSWEFRARTNGEWVPFNDMINSDKRGLHLGRGLRGTEMQLQARALTQDAWIAEYRLVPRYAQLGLISAVI